MYNKGDVVQLKKPHACGERVFEITRVGADYKLKCRGCGHVVLMDSLSAEKAIKKVIIEDGSCGKG